MEEDIKKKIHSLDNSFPDVNWTPEDVWNELHKKKSAVRYIGWSVAAAIIVGAAIFFWPSDKETITITYREEKIVPDTIQVSTSWSIIEESCRANLEVCESKEFTNLKTQWEELHREGESLIRQEETYGQNPAISKAKQKVESIKRDLEKEMLSMINS